MCSCNGFREKGKKAINSAHNEPQPGNKLIKFNNHPIISHKEAQRAGNLQSDSLQCAESNDNACGCVESTVLEVQAKKFPNLKISQLLAVINAVNHYDIKSAQFVGPQCNRICL